MKRITQLFLLLPLVCAAGCQKEASQENTEIKQVTGEIPIRIHAALAGPRNATKAIIQGTEIPDDFSYGIFVCKNGETDKAHKQNSWNLKSSYSAIEDSWSYYYVEDYSRGTLSSTSNDHITVTAREDGATADLYAYAPHNETTAAFNGGPTAIPFTISENLTTQGDLMYAAENISQANTGLDPKSEEEGPLEANFTFKHAFALLAFNFEVRNKESNSRFRTQYSLTHINIRKNQSTAKLYKSGTFDITTGSFNYGDCIQQNEIKVRVNEANSNLYIIETQTAYIAMVPIEVEDDDLVFEFVMNDMTVKPFVLKKEYVKHTNGDYGFKSGFKYTFNLTLDNYLYLDGFNVAPWDDRINYFNQEI